MIPKRLELTNFLSYRDTAVVDFSDIHLACVSGANGAGKSSIMDGITWALFGKSRSRYDDDLVNRQAYREDETAEVRFTFALEGVTYRILRSKRAGKTAVLELQLDAGDGQWRPLSESRLRETQSAIEDLLRMNYDTFINASFLLQGKADEFTTRTANDRKQILADLLGVTQWDSYREMAATARKEAVGQETLLEARLADIGSELAEEETRRQALAEAEAQQQIVADRLQLREALLLQMRQIAATLKQLRQSATDRQTAVQRASQNLAALRDTLAKRKQEKETWDAVLADEAAITAAYGKWREADQQVQAMQALAEQHHALERQMQPLQLAIGQEQSRLETRHEALQAQQGQVRVAREKWSDLQTQIAAQEQELKTLQAQSETLAVQAQALSVAQADLQQLRGERRLLEKEMATLQEQARQLDQLTSNKNELERSLVEGRAATGDLEEQIEVISAQRTYFAELQAEIKAIETRQPLLKQEMAQLRARLDQLEDYGSDGICPVCGQSLSTDHRLSAIATLQEDGSAQGDLYRDNQKRLKALAVELPQVQKTIQKGEQLEAQLQQRQQQLAKMEAQLEALQTQSESWSSSGQDRLVEVAASLADKSDVSRLEGEVAALQEEVAGTTAVQRSLDEVRKTLAARTAQLGELQRLISNWDHSGQAELEDVTKQLSEQTYAQEQRTALKNLQAQVKTLAYDQVAHQQARAARQAVAEAPEKQQTLQRAQAALGPLSNALSDLVEQISQQENELATQQEELAAQEAQIASLASGSEALPDLEDEVAALREEVVLANNKVGHAQQTVAVLDKLREQAGSLLEQKEEIALRIARLKRLELACGRKGVQALLIDAAVPDIEDRANDLLERLTGGDMHIRFQTQRQKKSGDDMMETLDIVIEDRNGARPYENYSGGEQFRINFAIRLALSQLLTHRTGARLQTLVVDEGFGSQDPLGRQRLIEAINTVQDEFACILVITHIDELRDAFPTRIEVQKEAGSSQIRVI